MPSEMAERIARAMIKHLRPAWQGGSDPREIDIDDSSVDFIELAEIAIEAIREPTEAMKCAGNEIREPCDLCSGSICVADQVWLAMIDAALTPSTPA